MKTGEAGINSHIALTSTTIALCFKIVLRDGTVLGGMTTHDKYIIYDGLTYRKKSAITQSNYSQDSGLNLSTMDIDVLIDTDLLTQNDIRARKLDSAEVYCFIINWANTADGIIKLIRGTISDIELKRGMYIAKIDDLQKKLQNEILRVFSPLCDAEFGDSTTGCYYDLVAVTQSGTVNTVTDAKNFNSADITISANDEFNLGKITFTSGNNNGITIEIKDSATNGDIELYIAAPFTIAPADTFDIAPGCDKIFTTCQGYGQNDNFRGFPDLPGEDARFDADIGFRS